MEAVHGVCPGEVYWAASDIGWVVGHSYIVYAPTAGCTTILYEGKPVGTPGRGRVLAGVCRSRRQRHVHRADTIRAMKREDPGELVQGYDLSALRTLFLAGERCDPDTLEWASLSLDRPVIDHWWQTESGWPMAANCVGLELLPVKPGSPTKPVPGYEVCVLDEDGGELPAGETGAVCVRLPLPPGFAPTLWRGEQRFVDAYLSRYEGST
jgi:propionyl-CoA synthetase